MRHGAHTISRLSAHIVWITKYRHKVLDNEVKPRLQELIKQTCNEFDVEILSGVIAKDHLHMLIEYPPKLSLSEFLKNVKGRSSRMIRQEFGRIKKIYYGGSLWADGYGAWSVGGKSEDKVALYLKHHNPSNPKGEGGFIFEE